MKRVAELERLQQRIAELERQLAETQDVDEEAARQRDEALTSRASYVARVETLESLLDEARAKIDRLLAALEAIAESKSEIDTAAYVKTAIAATESRS